MPKLILSKAAVISFALGVVGLFVQHLAMLLGGLAIVLGFFSLTRIPRTRFMRGKRVAVAGILFGGLGIILWLLL